MAEGGEKKRKAGLDLDFDQLLSRHNEPPPELMIVDASEKSMPAEDVEVVDPLVENFVKNTDKDLIDKISRSTNFLQKGNLPDGGTKLRARLTAMEAELARRKLLKDDKKCKKVTTLGDESTCNGPINDLSQPRAPPCKRVSEFSLQFCTMLDEDATGSFREELSTLNGSDHVKTRDHKSFSAQITQKKGLSSRQAPFKSPSLFPVNVDNQQQTNREQRGGHDFNPSSHRSDRDASCRSSKKESGAHSHSLRPLNSRRNNRKTVVLVDEEEEELEVDVVDETDLVGQSSKGTRIYYPSRDDPKSVQICYSDMKCLNPVSYLSSPIMNFYIRYLQKPTSPSARTERDFLIFNTYFYEKLKQDVLTKVASETLGAPISLDNQFDSITAIESSHIHGTRMTSMPFTMDCSSGAWRRFLFMRI